MSDKNPSISTSGGSAIGGNANVGGNFTGRDQITINFFGTQGSWAEIREKLFTTLPDAIVEQRWTDFDWAAAEQAYRAKLIHLYDRVRVLGKPGDQPLGDLFTAVYILDKPTARWRHNLDELQKRGFDRDEFQRQPGERIDGLVLVKQGRNLFILGKPGAGKTTLLKHVAVQTARQPLERVPILVNLNEWATSRWGKGDQADLLPFLVEQFAICNFPDAGRFITYLLQAGRGLVLFDGLDEVRQEAGQRHALTHLLQSFARQYDRSQHLITCRIAASEYAFAGFDDVEVADFTPAQVTEYASKWFGAETPKLAAFQSELARPEHAGLRELGNIPLLLSLLCLTFDENMRFPPNRAELYEDALETLLRKWDSSRSIQRDEIYRTLSPKRKSQLFGRIAFRTFEQGMLFFRRRDLAAWIDEYLAALPGAAPADEINGADVLRAIEAQHSIFVERATDIYAFSHLTFQEYFAALHIKEEQQDIALMEHLTDPRWREVFLLTAAMRSDASEFFNLMRWAIDQLVPEEPALGQLLKWADEYTNTSKGQDEQRATIRLAYVSFLREFIFSTDLVSILNFARILNFSLAIQLMGVLARERVLTIVLARSLNRAHARARALFKFFDLNIEHDLNQAHSRIQLINSTFADLYASISDSAFVDSFNSDTVGILNFTCPNILETESLIAKRLSPMVGFDYGVYYIWLVAKLLAHIQLDRRDEDIKLALPSYLDLFNRVIDLGRQAGQTFYADQLASLCLPLTIANPQKWQHFADEILEVLTNRKLLLDWNFTSEQLRTFDEYFYANELLGCCLEVAVVADRQAILAGLLAPPT